MLRVFQLRLLRQRNGALGQAFEDQVIELAAHGLPAVIAEYRATYPGIGVQLHNALSDQCLNLLRQGKVDLAITAPNARPAEFDTRTLCSDPFYLVCRRDHALAGQRRLQLAELAGCELIHLAKSTSVRQHVELLTQGIAVRDSGLEVEHLTTVAGLIEHGLGVALVPALTVFPFRKPQLVAVPLAHDQPERPSCWPRSAACRSPRKACWS